MSKYNHLILSRIVAAKLIVLFIQLFNCQAYAQDTTKTLPNGTDGLVFIPKKADTVFVNSKNDLAANEFEGKFSTFKIGLGYIGDFTSYAQSSVFKQQMDSAGLNLNPSYKTRDFRILGSGRFLKTKRYLAWKFAYMYDGDKKVWMLRESGLTIGVPELAGNIFIGRTKEGYSMVKVMNGHSLWGNERQMALDPIPILADGIKYFGYLPKSRIFWNLGYYNDFISKGQSFSTFKWQYVARVGWMPYYNKEKNGVLHIAGNFQYAKPLDDKFTIKSRPESNPTPQLINTGEFQAQTSTSIGGEIYYSYKSLMIGSEINTHNFFSDKTGNHHFYGGDFVVSYYFTGTNRPYNTVGSIFGFTKVRSSVFKKGLGEIEGVLRFSTFNLNNGDIKGGQFWRITPMVNWYLTKALRWELIYGYGVLDRYGLKGHVQFFESRIQLTVM
jgi:phosphate-selective porin OprO/OprP